MRIAFNRKHIFLLLAGVSVLLIISLYIFFILNNVTYIEYSSVIDERNDRELVGLAHNVFIGKVISQSGNKK